MSNLSIQHGFGEPFAVVIEFLRMTKLHRKASPRLHHLTSACVSPLYSISDEITSEYYSPVVLDAMGWCPAANFLVGPHEYHCRLSYTSSRAGCLPRTERGPLEELRNPPSQAVHQRHVGDDPADIVAWPRVAAMPNATPLRISALVSNVSAGPRSDQTSRSH